MVGSTVGPYEISSRLGAGGMGEVFLGHDPRLQRRVALKCLTKVDAHAGELRARVLREARAAARLNHPNIAAVYDVLEHDGKTFIVMEYVEGISLAVHIAKRRLPIDQVRAIGQQIASALAAAHANGVIHRDLKPANIQVTSDGSIKVLDFGVAKISSAMPSSTGAPTGAGVDATLGGNPGTPIYMAPEQLLEKEVDARADIYSADVILFEMATGRRPYQESSSVALAIAMMSRPAPRARSIHPDVPQDLDDTIGRALERDPANRIQSARELARAVAGTTDAALTRGVRFGRRTPLWKVAAAVAVVASLSAVAWRPVLAMLGLAGARTGPVRPAVLAILPVDNPTADPQAENIGAGIASVVAENFGSIPGLTVLSRASTAPYETRRNDLQAMHREIGADYVLDLAMKATAPRAELVARLRKAGVASPVWEQTIGGDPLTVEQTLLDGLARVLEKDALSRRLSGAESARVHRVPTKSGEALLAYSEARALLGPSSTPPATARAVTLLQAAVAKDPAFALAYAALGDAYWEMYQREKNPELVVKATNAVKEALRIDPDQAPVHYSLGNMYQLTGRYEEAITALRRAIAIQPDSDESHSLLARVLSDKADYAAAADEAQRAVDIRESWNNFFTQGRVAYFAGHLDKALSAFRRTTELNPAFAGGFQMLGTTYQMQGDLDNAIGNYEHSIRLAPNAQAYSNLAMAYLRARRYSEAIAAGTEALKRDPQRPSLHRNLADAYKAMGRIQDARDQYTKALTLARDQLIVNPRDVITIALVALCEANLGQRMEAQRHAAEAAALGATNAELRFRLAKVYTVLNDRPAAFATLRAAISAGYEPNAAKADEELISLHGSEFDAAVRGGLEARGAGGGRQEK